jgi:hypothetical protein
MNEPLRTQMMDRLWDIQLSQGFINDEEVSNLAKEFNLSAI